MSAYIIVGLNPTNAEKLQQYSAAVPATLIKYQGEFLAKGPGEVLSGEAGRKVQVILNFPSRTLAYDWYHSEEYQALIPTRDAGMDADFKLLG